MRTSAIEAGVIDHQVRAADVGRLLTRLADREIEDTAVEPDTTIELENRIATGKRFSTSFDRQEKSKLARRMAKNVGSGPLHDRYFKQPGEAEHAVAVLTERLSMAYGETGERGAG